ncbi:rhodanese-related sulfurtransferase [Niallia taxi]|uniref:oxygen-dependent tRNA uridine(34) hydroxylase TrhO n=1 Tax=Niallia taxi TaxID=2499688 RepID=UPI0011A44AE8|nr:rhodanese-related sulfurtransferase [Niallia taxi]MCT2345149.1 rhodanese-related sulfurtransferase [Niallia taxi]MDE5055770.1 rhodanese-related sulfurtransferase [Niallia taxi]MED3961455.1 rhodanese-related sulfurtransferase [Niallia taxi]
MSEKPYRVLLYYKYVTIENPEEFTSEHLAFCKELGLLGRILVSSEGINGTVSGTVEQTDKYMEAFRQDPRLADTVFKIDEEEGHAFKKMHVRHKKELVNLSLEDDVNPLELTGKHLKPTEWFEQMQDPNSVIIDARNDYEFDLGHFRGAIKPDIETFRELPQWIEDNREMLEGKKILTYCTGGVRCEKFSGWLKREGFDDVSQLDGGIVTYGKDPEAQGKLWDGQCYVFDQRISVPVNRVEHVVVGKDYFTGEPCERYVNCANPECNRKILASPESEEKFMKSCSHECRTHPRNLYVKANELTPEQVEARVKEIAEWEANHSSNLA